MKLYYTREFTALPLSLSFFDFVNCLIIHLCSRSDVCTFLFVSCILPLYYLPYFMLSENGIHLFEKHASRANSSGRGGVVQILHMILYFTQLFIFCVQTVFIQYAILFDSPLFISRTLTHLMSIFPLFFLLFFC